MNASEKRYQSLDVPRDDRPIRVGSLLFTMVEPHKGHEVAYNRWYERDHFYAGCMVGKWQFAGSRYVATRDCKAKRYPSASPITPDASVGSYLAVYWVLDEHHDDWNEWGVEQVNWLHANERMFEERDHIHTALYRYAGEANAPGSNTPVELALDRAYRGIAVLIGEMADGVDGAQVSAWLGDLPCPADVALVGTPLPLRDDRPGDVPDTQAANRVLVIGFLEDDPLATWDTTWVGVGDAFSGAGLGSIVFASPFLATVPGTDTYTDQLWERVFESLRRGALRDIGDEPDVRFTYANERTFLAWSRTALALVVTGIAATQLLPELDIGGERKIIGIPLIVLGAVIEVVAYQHWFANERAMRLHEPLPQSRLVLVLAFGIAVVGVIATVVAAAQ